MDVVPPLVADGQATKLAQPGQGPLHHPAMTAKSSAGVDPFAGDPDLDVATGQGTAATRDVVRLICVEFGRTAAGASTGTVDRRDRVKERLEHDAVVPVGARQAEGERSSSAETSATTSTTPSNSTSSLNGSVPGVPLQYFSANVRSSFSDTVSATTYSLLVR